MGDIYIEVLVDSSLVQLDKLEYLGSGIEGVVYRYFDESIKAYKENCSKYRLDLDTASSLSLIDTSRILLPRRLVYSPDDGEFLGYMTKYIDKGSKRDVFEKNVSRFCDELDDILRKDIVLLSNNKVLIEDLILGNTVFNNSNVFLIDSGSYRFTDSSCDDVLFNNLWELRDFITYDLLGSVAYSRRKKSLLKKSF